MSRVVVLTRGLPLHHAGGMESVAWDLCRALRATTVTAVTVLTTSLPGRPARADVEGVDVHALPATTPGRYSRTWWHASRTALAGELARGDVTGVLSVSAAAHAALDLPAAAGARLVLQAHGTSVMELTSKLTSRRLRPVLTSVRNVAGLLRDVRAYRRFDDVVAVGPSVAASLTTAPLGRYVAMPPVHVVANGVDTTAFRPDPAASAAVRRDLALPTGARVLLVAGRLHPQKRVDRALHCLRGLDADVHLVLAGDGPHAGALRALAGGLGLDGRVHFLGTVDRGRVAALAAAADASLLTSQWREGLPMAVLESLACGTPVVTARTTAPVDGVGDAVVRVDAGDERALTDAVRGVLARGRSAGSLLPARYELRTAAAAYARLLGCAR